MPSVNTEVQTTPERRPPAHGPSSGEEFYARVFALLTLLVLGTLIYKIFLPFFGSILWAAFIAFLLIPLHRRLLVRLRNRPKLSASILTLATLVLLIGPLTALSATFIAQTDELVKFIQQLISNNSHSLADLTSKPLVGRVLQLLQKYGNISPAEVQGWLVEGSRAGLQFFAAMSGKVFMGALGTVMGFTLTMFLLFFFICDGEQMLATFRSLIPLSHDRKEKLFNHIGAVTRAVVMGTCLTALIQGAMVGIAFLIVGLPSPVVFGALAALLALLPIGGTAFVWGPAAAVLFFQGHWVAGIFMLAWGVVLVGTIDNLLRPLLVSGRAPVATLTVFIGVLGGVAAFGTIGLFLGPVVLALVIALLQFLVEARKEAQALRRGEHPEAGA